jgi:hypothetical protein
MSLNITFFRTEVVNKDEALRCINKAIEIDERSRLHFIKSFD